MMHFNDGGRLACGERGGTFAPTPEQVTCRKCLATEAYAAALNRVRDTMTLTVKDAVDGSKQARKQSRGSHTNTRRFITTTLSLDECDPEVVRQAKAARRSGQVFRIVSPTEIWIVNQ